MSSLSTLFHVKVKYWTVQTNCARGRANIWTLINYVLQLLVMSLFYFIAFEFHTIFSVSFCPHSPFKVLQLNVFSQNIQELPESWRFLVVSKQFLLWRLVNAQGDGRGGMDEWINNDAMISSQNKRKTGHNVNSYHNTQCKPSKTNPGHSPHMPSKRSYVEVWSSFSH